LAEINAVKFYASVRGIGTFSSKMPSVIFAKVEEGKDAIGSIYKTLFKKLKTINVKIDSRDYHPHITIARARHKCDKKQLLEFIDRNSDTEFGRFLCSEIKIKSSVLTNDGPIYTNLYTKALD
jgi:2'-5' RNA ligase